MFGYEGGFYIIASNITQFICLLTFDTEILVNREEASFYKDAVIINTSRRQFSFIKWAKETFGIDAITTNEQAAAIVKNTQVRYQSLFNIF